MESLSVENGPRRESGATSLEKALGVCEALSGSPVGLSVGDLARSLKLPAPTVHRLLSVLKRRGYVRQDEDTARYSLTLKMLDLSFRLLGRSELKLHAYPILREYVLRTGYRSFIAVPAAGEVTYVWSAGRDEVAMHTAYGREMPGHCSIYFDKSHSTRSFELLAVGHGSGCGLQRGRDDTIWTGTGYRREWSADGLHMRARVRLHGAGGRARRSVRARVGTKRRSSCNTMREPGSWRG